jgi:hypothetical protein
MTSCPQPLITRAWDKRVVTVKESDVDSLSSHARGINADLCPATGRMFEFDKAVNGGKDGAISAQAHIVTRLELGTPLTDDDRACPHCLASEPFHSHTFAGTIPTIAT